MKSDIRVCSNWAAVHERPTYTLGERCPECGADAVNSAPAPFNPEDPYGEYRRRARRRAAGGGDTGSDGVTGSDGDGQSDGTTGIDGNNGSDGETDSGGA